MTGHCRDCGEVLDHFGICPFADFELVKLSRSPVYCGHSADRNAVTAAVEIVHAIPASAEVVAGGKKRWR
jgi:hypothetical protein